MKVREYYVADILVIGGSLAGCRAALEANEFAASVIIVDQGTVGEARDGAVIGGESYAAPVPTRCPEDSWQRFFEDGWRRGQSLGDHDLLATVARHALQGAWDLERYGYRWERDASGEFVLGVADGHRYPRLLAPQEGQPPPAYALSQHVRRRVGMQILEHVYVTTLLQHKGRVVGAVGIDLEHEGIVVMTAGSTILATGHMEGLVRYRAGRGSGVGMGYRIGASLIGSEFQMSSGDHYTCTGGLQIDAWGRTTVPGLYAAGRVAGGIFGSSMLPGCEMASALVFGAVAGRSAALEQTPIPRIKEEGVKEETIRLQRFVRRMGRGRNAELFLDQFTGEINEICRAALQRRESAAALDDLWTRLATYSGDWYINVRRASGDVSLSELVDWVEVDYLLTLARLLVRSLQVHADGSGMRDLLTSERACILARYEKGEDRLETISATVEDRQLSPT